MFAYKQIIKFIFNIFRAKCIYFFPFLTYSSCDPSRAPKFVPVLRGLCCQSLVLRIVLVTLPEHLSSCCQSSVLRIVLVTLPEHLSSSPFYGVYVVNLQFSVECFSDYCLSFCSFSLGSRLDVYNLVIHIKFPSDITRNCHSNIMKREFKK